MNTKDRIKQARDENKALRARHQREHEQSRKKWERACMPLVEKASTFEEAGIAYRSSPRSTETRKKAMMRWIDHCTTLAECRQLRRPVLKNYYEDEVTEHFDAKLKELGAPPNFM